MEKPNNSRFKAEQIRRAIISLLIELQYLFQTRPDLTYTINQITQFVQEPRTLHLNAAKRILIKLSHGLHFSKTNEFDRIIGYCDRDTRMSSSWYCVFIGDNLVS